MNALPRSSRARRAAAVLAAAALVGTAAAPSLAGGRGHRAFEPLATFEVDGEVAEIVAATPDEQTLVYTDSSGAIGAVDIADPAAPQQLWTLPLDGSPTSVTITPDGRRALVAVDTSDGAFAAPSGYLAAVDLRRRAVVQRVQLGGQPDSIALTRDGRTAAVAIENQRDEDIEVGGVEGGIPQAPAGFLAVVDVTRNSWQVDAVGLTGLPGALFASDPEPEYVDVDERGVAAVTLQENNAVALVDLKKRKVIASFSAGAVVRDDADLVDDDVIAFDDVLVAPREPDTIQWTREGNLVVADEGDLFAEPSGGRGWTVFSPEGDVVWESGSSAERALAEASAYDDGRSDDKGAELEGPEVARIGGARYAFIGAERGDAVLVYDLTRDRDPRLLQVLPVGDAPEGLVALERRGLFVASNEDDGTLSVFGLTGD